MDRREKDWQPMKRKRRRKNKPGQGRKAEGRVVGTIGMLPEAWDKLDAMRGRESRGKVVERLIF